MRLVRTEDAVGHVLCHDMTQILTGDDPGAPRFKGPRFRKGHVVTAEDVPVLLSMGKRSLYVWELEEGMVHEDDAARRMAALVAGPGTEAAGEPSEGKVNVRAATDGVLLVDSARLAAVNSVDEVMVATRRGGFAVRAGDLLAGTRVIPLVIAEERLAEAEAAAGPEPSPNGVTSHAPGGLLQKGRSPAGRCNSAGRPPIRRGRKAAGPYSRSAEPSASARRPSGRHGAGGLPPPIETAFTPVGVEKLAAQHRARQSPRPATSATLWWPPSTRRLPPASTSCSARRHVCGTPT